MKVVGVGESLIWLCWFFHALLISVIAFTISTIILKYPFNGDGTQAIYFVTFPVLWTLIMLFTIANVMFCFTFCAIFHKCK